jgi:hypothetical protein
MARINQTIAPVRQTCTEKSDAVIGLGRVDDNPDVSPRMNTRPRNDSRRAQRHLLILFHSRDLGHALSLQDYCPPPRRPVRS